MALTKKDLEEIEKVSTRVFLNGVDQVILPVLGKMMDEINDRFEKNDQQHETTRRWVMKAMERLDNHEDRIGTLEKQTTT
jgi:hypothetical protein